MNASQKRSRSSSSKPRKRFRKAAAVPAVLQLRRPEKKTVDVNKTALTFDSTGNFLLLNAPVTGAGEYQRVGRKISMQSVSGRISIFATAPATAGADFIRLVLFYDRQPNGAAPVLADVLQSVDNTGTTTSTSMSNLNINNADRFKILRDWYWGIPQAGTGTNAELARTFAAGPCADKFFVSLKGMETHFNGNSAGTIGDIATGSLYLLAVGLQSNANASWRVNCETRVRYLDQ